MEIQQVNKSGSTSKKRLAILLFFVAVAMFGFGYALVPMYNVLCDVLGINGKFLGGQTDPRDIVGDVDTSRTITVRFLATNNEQLPWTFYPTSKIITVHPGEIKHIAYFAQNNSGKKMTVQAIPSVFPSIATKFLKKTECFCFNQQTLENGENQPLPLAFHIDRDLPKDIDTVVLSYTLFDTAQISMPINKEKGRIN